MCFTCAVTRVENAWWVFKPELRLLRSERDDRLQEWIQPQRQCSCYFVVRWHARVTLLGGRGAGEGSTVEPSVGMGLLV